VIGVGEDLSKIIATTYLENISSGIPTPQQVLERVNLKNNLQLNFNQVDITEITQYNAIVSAKETWELYRGTVNVSYNMNIDIKYLITNLDIGEVVEATIEDIKNAVNYANPDAIIF
jgi:hypothetical protein